MRTAGVESTPANKGVQANGSVPIALQPELVSLEIMQRESAKGAGPAKRFFRQGQFTLEIRFAQVVKRDLLNLTDREIDANDQLLVASRCVSHCVLGMGNDAIGAIGVV